MGVHDMSMPEIDHVIFDRDDPEGKSSQWWNVQMAHLISHLAWNKRWPEVNLNSNSHSHTRVILPTTTCGVALKGFSYLRSTAIQKCYMENSRNNQFISKKWHAVLNSIKKPCSILVCSTVFALVMNHPFVQHIHSVYIPLLLATL